MLSIVSTMFETFSFIASVLCCAITDVLVLKDLIQDASCRKSEFKSRLQNGILNCIVT